jgi:hypothetical protein
MIMNNRRNFLATAGALVAASALPSANGEQRTSLYIHGLVWNRQLTAPMNDWIIRLHAVTDIPVAGSPGVATLGDDFHDAVGSHADIQVATLISDQLTLIGTITESKKPELVGQTVRVDGKLTGTIIQGLTVTIGSAVFTGAGPGWSTCTGSACPSFAH